MRFFPLITDLEYTFTEIAKIINGELIGENGRICAISTDSREKFNDPWCFFAIKGEKFNGTDYLLEAIDNGAKLVVSEEKISCPVKVSN